MTASTLADAKIETGWIQTYTGRKFYPLAPDPADVAIEDIAHALSLQCRYSGHCSRFFSVAQHSVLVSENCPTCPLWGLLHDAAEAYLVDLPRPIKQELRKRVAGAHSEFDLFEQSIMRAIGEKFALAWREPAEVGAGDLLLLATEARDLMSPLHPDWHYQEKNGFPVLAEKIQPWPAEVAKLEFLRRFHRLYRGTP